MITDGFPITKTRYELGDPWPGWIVDEFADANAGLVVAELEVPTEDTPWEVPVWAGEERDQIDFRYTNSELFSRPYTTVESGIVPVPPAASRGRGPCSGPQRSSASAHGGEDPPPRPRPRLTAASFGDPGRRDSAGSPVAPTKTSAMEVVKKQGTCAPRGTGPSTT